MYYNLKIRDKIRVPPKLFKADLKQSIKEAIMQQYEGVLVQDVGLLLSYISIDNIGEGIIIPGDGAIYYETIFNVLTWAPENQELVEGEVGEITEFGAFVKMGIIDGLAHISQVMDDFVNFSKSGVLTGRESKKVLRTGDIVRARIVAASLKHIQTAKIGLTMRQEGLGKPEWKELKKKKITTGKKTAERKEGKYK